MRKITRGRKRWLALAVPTLTVTGALVAWALVSADSPFSGSVTGEEAVAATAIQSVNADSENNSKCSWSRTAEGGIRLVVDKAPRGVPTVCKGSVTLQNNGNLDLAVQSFVATGSGAGTVTSGISQGSSACGRTVAPGATTTAPIKVQLDNVPVGANGTLTGKLTLVDSGSYSSTGCGQL